MNWRLEVKADDAVILEFVKIRVWPKGIDKVLSNYAEARITVAGEDRGTTRFYERDTFKANLVFKADSTKTSVLTVAYQ